MHPMAKDNEVVETDVAMKSFVNADERFDESHMLNDVTTI